MNFYKHHLGDYDGATAHLSWDEDMAYWRLLRAYYRREQAIPDGEKYRLSRTSARAHRAAVDAVLNEFFELRDGLWHNARADEEITAYQAQATTNRRIAKTRTIKRIVHGPSDGSSPDRPTISPPNQEPETRNQKSSSTADGLEPTAATQIAIALRSMGVKNASAMNPDVIAWADAGVTVEQAREAARIAIEDRHVTHPATGYLTPILNDMRTPPKARTAIATGAGKPWFIAGWSHIVAKGAELGLEQGRDETDPAFRLRVFTAAGVTEDEARKAEADWKVAA